MPVYSFAFETDGVRTKNLGSDRDATVTFSELNDERAWEHIQDYVRGDEKPVLVETWDERPNPETREKKRPC